MKLKSVLIAIASLCTAMSISAVSHEYNYTLDVQFRNMPDSVRFTLGSDNNKYKQKVLTSNGKLHFELDIKENYPVHLYLIGKNPDDSKDRFYISFHGGNGIKHNIISHRDGFAPDSLSFSGAPWDKARMEFDRYYWENTLQRRQLNNQIKELGKKFISKPGEPIKMDSATQAIHSSLMKNILSLQKEHNETLHRYISDNPNSLDALSYLSWQYKNFTHDELNALNSRIPDHLRQSPEVKFLEQLISNKIIEIGDPIESYDLSGENIDGSPIQLSQFTTPYIIVDFNSLGCGACRRAAKEEIPEFLSKYGDSVFFVSFSVEDDRKRMERTHEIDKATWPTIWDGKGASSVSCLKYGVTSYPTFFIFGPDRKLLKKWSGWGPGIIEASFKEVSKEPASTN